MPRIEPDIIEPRIICPLFVLVDRSGSMTADNRCGIVNKFMERLMEKLHTMATDSFRYRPMVAVMTYAEIPEWLTENGPVDVEAFQWEPVRPWGPGFEGKAFRELDYRLSRAQFLKFDVPVRQPVILLISDGCSSLDDAAEELKRMKENKWFTNSQKLVLAVREDSDEIFREFTGSKALIFTEESQEDLLERLAWVLMHDFYTKALPYPQPDQPVVDIDWGDDWL